MPGRSWGGEFSDENLIQVNRNKSLPADYVPQDLINISGLVKTIGVVCIKQEATSYLKQMFDDASKQNIALAVTSGFRRPEIQSILYKLWLVIEGQKGKEGIAEPLYSEHQLGTTVDLSGKSIGYSSASDKFDGTIEGVWLKQNAHIYGFVMSYPEGKQQITGYIYEPWHYRFVGIEAAKQIFDTQISVEEYFSSLQNTTTADPNRLTF